MAKHKHLKIFGVVAVIGILVIVGIVGKSGNTLDVNGISGYFATSEKFSLFNTLALLKTGELTQCDISQKVYRVDADNNQKVLAGTGVEENISSLPTNDLLTSSTNKLVNGITGELQISCPSSSTIDATLYRAVLTFQVFGTNSKGETVKIKDFPISNVAQQSLNGKRVTLLTWALTPEEIESKIGKGTTTYTTTMTSNAIGTLTFKERPSDSQTWDYSLKGDSIVAIRYKVVSPATNSPIDDIFGQIASRKVEVRLLNNDDAIVDISKSKTVVVLGTLYQWDKNVEGYPILNVYYTDPVKALPSERVTPILTKTLTSYKGTAGSSNIVDIADFTNSVYLGSNPKLGEYKITFSSAIKNGKPIRDTVASTLLTVVKPAPAVKTVECSAGTHDEGGTCVIDAAEDKPSATDSSDANNISTCLKTLNLQCLLGGAQSVLAGSMNAIIIIIVFLIIIAIAVSIFKHKSQPIYPRY